MYKTAREVSNLVRSKYMAQQIIADLLQRFTGETAFNRMEFDAFLGKQSVDETAWRTAGNLLESFVTRKVNGEVVL